MQDRVKRVDELEMKVGEIIEVMAQIQDQSELSNSNIANSKAEVEIGEAITLDLWKNFHNVFFTLFKIWN